MTPSRSPLIVGSVSRGNAAQWGFIGSAGEVGIVDGGPATVYHSDSSAAAHVLVASELTGAFATVVLALTGTLAAAETATTDTAANIIAAMPAPGVGASYMLRIINESSGNFAWTVVGGSGVTVSGTATVAQNTWRDFVVTVASATTVTMQSAGTGTNS